MKKLGLMFMALMLTMMLIAGGAAALDVYDERVFKGKVTFQKRHVIFKEISAPSGHPATNYGWLYVKDKGSTSALYFEDDNGDVIQLAVTAPAWDDITDPDANSTIAMSTYTMVHNSVATSGDMWNFKGEGDFANISVFRVESATGNPTDGTVLEVISHDTDADALIVTANSATRIAVAGSGNVSITGLTGVIDYTDFDVSADGAVVIAQDDGGTGITISPSAALTTAIDATDTDIVTALNVAANAIVGTTGVIDYTNFDVAADGDLDAVDGDFSGNVTVTGNVSAVNGTFTGDVSITGAFNQDALVPASASPHVITLDGATSGGVTIGATSTGPIILGANGAGATSVSLPATVDLTLAGGELDITDTANTDLVDLVNNTATTGSILDIDSNATTSGSVIHVTADALDTGTMLYLDSAGIPASTYYIKAYNGSGIDFSVMRYGATTILGNVSTDVLTVTAGDIQITDGDIDLDSGFMAINTGDDETTSIIRNKSATTGPVVEIEETDGSADNAALLIDQNATAAGSYGLEIDTAGGTAIYASLELTTGNGIEFAVPASYTGQLIKVSDTLVGTTGEGIIDIHTTANIASGATLVRLDADTGTLAGATDGFMLDIDDDSVGVGTSYAVEINSASNEALLVSSGEAVFTEQTTHTAGINADGDVDIDFSSNSEEMNITTLAQDMAAGSGVATIFANTGAAGQANASYLLRLAREGDGDAEAHFLLCEDNSDGTANNGDDMCYINSGGAMFLAGGLEVDGAIDVDGAITGDGSGEITGMLSELINSSGNETATIANCTSIHTNSGASGGVVIDLPEASTAIGCCYTFVTVTAQNFDINPDDADTILVLTDSTADSIRNATAGNSVTLCAIDSTNWVTKGAEQGTWTDID